VSLDHALSVGDMHGLELSLTAGDSKHASRVLRLREGDECEVVVKLMGAVRATEAAGTGAAVAGRVPNAAGAAETGAAVAGRVPNAAGAAVYAATVSAVADPVRVRLGALLESTVEGPEYRVEVGLAQALTRPSLIDHVIEKGTEVGASSFLLVHATASPSHPGLARPDRIERWRRIAREAAKQSRRTVVPIVDATGLLAEALEHPMVTGALSLVLEPGASTSLQQALLDWDGASTAPGDAPWRVTLWVGPEGGWAPAELQSFSAAGIASVRLGRSVLRTETAGPVAVAAARLTLRDW
jgi:16S rRNA (uracil1498-N3)-methyltransferase